MATPTSLSNQFLIAMPTLADPNFSRTVTFLCEHSDQGALGIVINRSLDITLGEIFEQMEIETGQALHVDAPVYQGGPVQNDHGFVLHKPLGNWQSTLPVTETVGLTTSQDILQAIAEDRGPDDWLVALGYAGWGPGQLERELSENAWLNGPADTNVVFRLPEAERWQAAAQKLGVDLSTLSGDAGHA
jgi:putative transcriptional regulator